MITAAAAGQRIVEQTYRRFFFLSSITKTKKAKELNREGECV